MKTKKGFTITQLLTGLVLSVVFLFTVFGFYSIQISNKQLSLARQEKVDSKVELVGSKIVDYLKVQQQIWRAYSQSPLVFDTLNAESLEKNPADTAAKLVADMLIRMKEYEQEYGYSVYNQILLTDSVGNGIANTSQSDSQKYSEGSWWKKTVKNGSLISDVFLDPEDNKPKIYIGILIDSDSGWKDGVLRVTIDLREVSDIIDFNSATLNQFATNELILLGGKKQVIHHSRADDISPLSNGTAYVAPFEQGVAKDSGTYLDKGSDKTLYGLSHSLSDLYQGFELPWILIARFEDEEIFGSVRKSRRNLLYLGLTTCLLSALLANFVILFLRRKFSTLNHAALKLASGDFDVRIGDTGQDEFSLLGRTFDYMASEVKERNIVLEEGRSRAETSEKRRRITLSAARVVEWEYHVSDKEIAVVNSWDADLGLPQNPGFSGKFKETIKSSDWTDFTTKVDQISSAHGGLVEHPVRIADREDSVYWLLLRGQIIDKNNQIVAGIALDITAQKELEQKLSQVNRLEAIGQLAAGIAHEINTPMQYIGDNLEFLKKANTRVYEYADTLEESILDEKLSANPENLKEAILDKKKELKVERVKTRVPEAIKDSIEGVKAVSKIIRAMKDFSHMDRGDDKILVDINKIVESAVDVSRHEWKYVADVQQTLDSNLDEVMAYSGELNQVFLNIIVNSAHAIQERVAKKDSGEKGLIQIATKNIPHQNSVTVIISDNGEGIDEKVKSKIFDQFFTTKEVGKGTGQGLSLCRSIVVSRHQGNIDVWSKRGEGTKFTITLPKQ